MADSEFWRSLAVEFRAIDPYMWLRADWHFFVKAGEEYPPVAEWRLVGPTKKHSLQFEFESLARRAGPKVHPVMDSFIGWMEALREFGMNMESHGVGAESDSNGIIIGHRYFGTISQVCHASFALCKHYESIALEAERMASVLEPAPSVNILKAELKSQKERAPRFPRRVEWLRQRLAERGWNHNDPQKRRGPDRKTVLKILDGGDVRESVLESLAESLSQKHSKVDLLDIPRD